MGRQTHKQVYIYGGLDREPHHPDEELRLRLGSRGMAAHPVSWNHRSRDTFSRFRSRVAAGLKTTFASSYTSEVSLAGMLDPLAFRRYAKQATGEKYLVVPHLGEQQEATNPI